MRVVHVITLLYRRTWRGTGTTLLQEWVEWYKISEWR